MIHAGNAIAKPSEGTGNALFVSPSPPSRSVSVGMGQVALLGRNQSAKAVLGSCIGVVLYHQRVRCAAVAHVVLAEGEGRAGLPGKFADVAIPFMIDQLARRNAHHSGLVAKIAGGASMFGSSGPIQIGRDNRAAIENLLRQRNVPLVGEHVGGRQGRRIEFDTCSGTLRVFLAGQPEIVL